MKNKLFDSLDKVEHKMEGYLPFTPIGIASRHLDKKAKTILDLGCGAGDPMLFINRDKKYRTVGVDVFPDYLKICQKMQTHDDFIQMDIRNLKNITRNYDVVLAFRVLEHLTQEEGTQLLKDAELIAEKQVILITPVEDFKQTTFDNNKFQEHKYIWSPAELKSRGYKIYLNGLKGFQKDSAGITYSEKIIAYFGHGLWSLCGWIPSIFPSVAANMVAVKDLK